MNEQYVRRSASLVLTAAAAKSLQSCPTLCDPKDVSPPDSPSLGFSRHIGTDQHHEHNWGKNIQHPVRTEKNSLGLRDEEDWPELHLQAELEQIKARLKGKNCTGAEIGVHA